MHPAACVMLPVAPAPRTARSRIPLVGPALDARMEAHFQAAFDRAEAAILATAAENGEAVIYTYSFMREVRQDARAVSLAVGIPATLGAAGLAGAAVGAPSSATGGALLLALAAAGVGLAREAGGYGSPALAGARIAAICTRSIIVAVPGRRDASVRRIPLDAIRAVVRNRGSVAIRLAGEEFVLDGLTDPKRFAGDAGRCAGVDTSRTTVVRPPAAPTGLDDDAIEVAAIRRRLRDRGWMLAVANDYRLGGDWHVFYAFTHPDGIAAKGEGRSDVEALRLAELDIAAKERWLADLKGSAA